MKKAIDNIFNAPVERKSEDYVKDGLIHCGNCHTPKQYEMNHPLTGKRVKVPVMCECEEAYRKMEDERREKADMTRLAKTRKQMGFPDSDYQRYTFENDDKANRELSKQLYNYANRFDEFKSKGHGLLLYGKVGTGKTYLAACIANKVIEDGRPVLMTNFSRLISQIQKTSFDKEDTISRLLNYDLLIIDDLGIERSTEYAQEIVYQIVDSRYKAGLPLVVTTNLTAAELKNPSDIMSDRIYGRLLERCLPIQVVGDNRRKKNADYDEMRKMLND